ncbi:hypothetical protein [Desulfosporosinus hippei]|uniref:Uncharacterized protein n=1 Tax=Desulfosporosinus hippei DSM 8344 TaxID=1121419 RepID=A0A1G7UIS2_9FIRM|nr:hypothetical protein [Desulfosporosinus hippei]SDG47151.1 hypothetical protein SAMN05443529_103150 [Desulfosporosinus hippei DSM 8344]
MTQQVQCSIGNPCAVVQLLEQRIESQEGRTEKMESVIESLRNRLPLWATMTMTAGGAVIGFLANKVL